MTKTMMGGAAGLRKGIAVVVVLSAGLLAGGALRGALEDARPADPEPTFWKELEVAHSDSAYDAATETFHGQLTASLVEEARKLRLESTVLVSLRGSDTESCEDLGRQLRELQRAIPSEPGWGLTVLVDAAGEGMVRGFLRRERLGELPIIVGAPDAFLADGRVLSTPAAMIVDREGHVRLGVSHTTRFFNLRSRSFSEELGLTVPGRT